MSLDINKINGYEILEFLNNLDKGTKEVLHYDHNLELPFEFESQEIFDGRYRLNFSLYFNNWGTRQIITDNLIEIFEDGSVLIVLQEPLEGSGCDDILREQITTFLQTHSFNDNLEKDFYMILNESVEKIHRVAFTSENKINLEDIIGQLKRAKSFIK